MLRAEPLFFLRHFLQFFTVSGYACLNRFPLFPVKQYDSIYFSVSAHHFLFTLRRGFLDRHAYEGIYPCPCQFFEDVGLFGIFRLEKTCEITLCKHRSAAELLECQPYAGDNLPFRLALS